MVLKSRSVSNSRGINSGGSGEQSVEAYKNPTELFQWINFGRWNKAIKRLKVNPSEACIWIYSENEVNGKKKWKYLPIHMVCLQPNPPLSIVEALIEAYPRGARCRDLDGNLAIHYLCLEACTDKQVLEVVINAYEESLIEKDKYGRTAYQIMEFETERRKVDPALRDSVLQYLKWKQSHPYEVSRDSRNDDEIARQIIEASNSRELTTQSKKKIQQQLKEVVNERDALKDQVDNFVKESKSNRKLISSLTNQLDKLSNSNEEQANHHKEVIEKLQAELESHKSQLASSQAQLREEQAKSLENSALKQRIHDLTQENFQCLQKLDQHKVVDMELASLREQLHKMKQETQQIQQERDNSHDSTIDLLKQEHQKQLETLKHTHKQHLDDQKAVLTTKIHEHNATLQAKFEELKAAYQKKLDQQSNELQSKHQSELQTLNESHTEECNKYMQTIQTLNEKHAQKVDEITKQMWKTEESNITDMKRLYQRKLDELKLNHQRAIEDQKSTYHTKHLTQSNEYRKIHDQLQFTTKEIELLRTEKLKCTQENFELRRKLDEQEIEFDKKLMTVRKAVASQADAFATLQNHFNLAEESINLSHSQETSLYFNDNSNSPNNDRLITITTEKHALEIDLMNYKKQHTLLMNENKSLRQQYQQLSDDYNAVQSTLKQAKELESSEEDKVRLMLSQRDDLQAELDLLTNRNKKLKEEICNLEDDNMKQKKERERAIEELTEKITTSQDKIAELRDMVTKNKTSYQEKLDSLTISYDKVKAENIKFNEKLTKLEPLLQQEQSTRQDLEKEKAILQQKLDELQCIANGLQNDNEDLMEKHLLKSSSFSSRSITNNPELSSLKHKFNELLHENEQHKETIIQQQESIRNLTDKITSYQKKIKILAIDKSAGRQRIVDELTRKITSLASSLLHLSNLQNRIVQSAVQTEKLYQRAAIEERQLLLQTISKQEKEYDSNSKKRDRLMKAMQKQEDISKEASIDREAILKDIYAKEEERKMKTARDRESILKAVLKLQQEIELVSNDIAML